MKTVNTNTHRESKCSLFSHILLTVLALFACVEAYATPDKGYNCAGCHSWSTGGMYLSNFQTYTNLGAGLRGLFIVTNGQTVGINITVTNTYDGAYGLTMNNLTGAGLSNSTHHMMYTPDPTWANRTTYYTEGPTYTAQRWTFNLKVGSNTPPDFYSIQTQMAGKDIDLTRWSQVVSYYVQVVAPSVPAPPTPQLTGMQKNGTNFSAQVLTTNGFTYNLEYRTSLSTGSWANAVQKVGDGTTKTLTDSNAVDQQRFYRVRVQ